jgi:tetratricopeptide (TPR) repeat protein
MDNLYRRSAVILGTTLVVGIFLWVIISNFIIRVVADTRVSLSRDALAAAASRFPNSPRVNFRLADTEIADAASRGRFDNQAEMHAMRAVNLSPWDYQSRRLLATIYELNGKEDEAEASLRAAAKLAPHHAALNWSLANVLLRRGKLGDALEPFRTAASSNLDLMPMAIETIWRSSGGNLETLKVFAGSDVNAQMSVVKFLTEQKLIDDAVSMFNAIDKKARTDSPRSPAFITALINTGQVLQAKNLWIELAAGKTPAPMETANGVWNGGFETDTIENYDHFDWTIKPNRYARIDIDKNIARSGARSLRVAFTGIDTTTLSTEIRQLVALNPGASYRLECYVKTDSLVTSEGPRLAISGPGGRIAQTEPVMAGSNDWQPLFVEFTAPIDAGSGLLSIVRTPRFSYDEPTSGIVWFDDLKLIEQ